MPPRREIPMTGVDNSEIAQMAQAMAQMAAAVAQQTAAKNQRDLQKQEREERAAEERGLVNFHRHDPPKYHGDADPENADVWLQEIEKIFEVLRCPDGVKVNYATYLLLGDAEYWWRSTRLMMEAAQQEITWEAFRKKFLDKYFPLSARTKLGDDFLKLRQGSMTIGEYAAKFESLSRYFKFFRQTVDEGYMCHRFLDGLRYEIQDSVLPLGIQQFQPLVEKCREVEEMKNKRLSRGNNNSGGPIRQSNQNQGHGKQEEKPYQRPQGNFGGQHRSTNPNAGGGDNGVVFPGRQSCFRYGNQGHYADKCTAKENLCYNCKKPGHLVRDFKAPKGEPSINVARSVRLTTIGRVYVMTTEAPSPTEDSIAEHAT